MRSRIILTANSTSRGGSWSWLDAIFSKNIGQNSNQSSLKIILKKILNVLDSRMIFYKLYLQPTVLKLREKKYKENIIDFTPKIIDNKQTGLYFLIIAKGNT